MAQIRKMFNSGCLGLVLIVIIFSFAAIAHAEYEIVTSSQDFSVDVPIDGTIVTWSEDISIQWEKPTMSVGDVLQGFVYKWNTSSAALSILTVDNADGTVDDISDPSIVQPASYFESDDSNLLRYLHIKTWYIDSSAGEPSYSDDVVIGPINIDNVAPSGTVRITDSEGDDIDSTYSSSLYLHLVASLAPAKVYINEEAVRPLSGSTYTTEVLYDLGDTTPGSKTVYVWFEDAVGNQSSTAAIDTVTLLSSISISPNEGTYDLASVENQEFIVDGTSDLYDWEITSGVTVAQFQGTPTSTNSVTVELLLGGSFTLQATPSGGGDPLTSGTYTVTNNIIKGDVDEDGEITIKDAVVVLSYSVDSTTLTDDQKSSGNVTEKEDNNNIDSGDSVKIIRCSFGLISDLTKVLSPIYISEKQVTFDAESVALGDAVTVSINVDDLSGIAGYNIVFEYNSTIINATEANLGSDFGSNVFEQNLGTPGIVKLGMVGVSGNISNSAGQLATVTFNVLSDAENSSLSFTRCSLKNRRVSGTMSQSKKTLHYR